MNTGKGLDDSVEMRGTEATPLRPCPGSKHIHTHTHIINKVLRLEQPTEQGTHMSGKWDEVKRSVTEPTLHY